MVLTPSEDYDSGADDDADDYNPAAVDEVRRPHRTLEGDVSVEHLRLHRDRLHRFGIAVRTSAQQHRRVHDPHLRSRVADFDGPGRLHWDLAESHRNEQLCRSDVLH